MCLPFVFNCSLWKRQQETHPSTKFQSSCKRFFQRKPKKHLVNSDCDCHVWLPTFYGKHILQRPQFVENIGLDMPHSHGNPMSRTALNLKRVAHKEGPSLVSGPPQYIIYILIYIYIWSIWCSNKKGCTAILFIPICTERKKNNSKRQSIHAAEYVRLALKLQWDHAGTSQVLQQLLLMHGDVASLLQQAMDGSTKIEGISSGSPQFNTFWCGNRQVMKKSHIRLSRYDFPLKHVDFSLPCFTIPEVQKVQSWCFKNYFHHGSFKEWDHWNNEKPLWIHIVYVHKLFFNYNYNE